MKGLIVALTLAPLAAANAEPPPAPADESPLIAYSFEINRNEDARDTYSRDRELKMALHALEHSNPPPNESCSKTLGASRFADFHAEIAKVRKSRGEYDDSLREYQAALACTPRQPWLLAELAWLHVQTGEIDEARALIDRAIAIDPDDEQATSVLPRVDFLQERWADATVRFRLAAMLSGEYDSEMTAYYQTYYWLAQRRAGVRTPQFAPVEKKREKETSNDDRDSTEPAWPAPIVDLLSGQKTEADIVHAIRDTYWEPHRRERLTEALFYVGELRLAEGDTETARRHFAAVLNLRVTDFIEYAMARAELAKFRERAAQQGAR